MQIIIRAALCVGLALCLPGCASGRPEARVTDPAQALGAKDGKVFVTAQGLAPETYTFISDIEIGTAWTWYGDGNSMLADKARKLGADAVIDADTKYYPSAISWAAPHGAGKAVKLKSKSAIDGLQGKWL